MNKTPEQILVDILKTEMSLDVSRVFVGNQNLKLPADNNIFVVVAMLHEKVLGSVNSTFEKVIASNLTDNSDNPIIDNAGNNITVEAGLNAFFERQEVVTRADIQIDILSRNDDARLRRWEIIAALGSIYSQQKQEENSFKIFRLPNSFVNSSQAEGGSNINRFSITIPTLSWYRKDKLVTGYDYFNNFTQRVDDEQTIGTLKGIIEFTIDENGVS